MLSKVTYSAPGNLMLMGEHAVLHDSACLAYAVNQRIRVRAQPIKKQDIIINSNIGTYTISLEYLHKLPVQDIESKFSFILAAVKYFNIKVGIEFLISSDFAPTIGLGSSAAVTVATVATIREMQNQNINLNNDHILKEIFMSSYDIMQQIQNRRGSGYDLATSIWGGVLEYRQSPMSIKKIMLDHLPISVIYSGYKTKTADVIKMIEHKESQLPNKYTELYQLIGDLIPSASINLQNHDWEQLGKLFDMNQTFLNELGVNDKILEKIIYWAKENGALGAKISGSGLGDCIISLGKLPDYPPNTHGITSLDIQITNQGLRRE